MVEYIDKHKNRKFGLIDVGKKWHNLLSYMLQEDKDDSN